MTGGGEAGGRALVLASHARQEEGAWSDPLVGYLALTLVVVVVAVVALLRRLGRAARARLEPSSNSSRQADAPRREAEFVVETFQTVIGELQHKERELALLTQRERERADRSELFSERVIAQMPTGLVVVHRSGRVTAANDSARDLFADLPRDRADEVAFGRAFRSAPALAGMIEDCLERAASFHRREVEMRAGTRAGSRWLGVSVSPIGPSGGEPEAALCLMTDLTEVVELRDRVRIQETIVSLGEMAAGLAHELKNSLAAIQGYAQLLAELAPERAHEPADALVGEVSELSRMVTDFLNFARPEPIAAVSIEILDLVRGVVARFEERAEAAGFEISIDAAGAERARVLADETLLGRALYNVVQNAIEALEQTSGERRVEVGVRCADGEVEITVRDTGPGIAEEDLTRVFIPFFTTRSRGYGIGLALTQKIVLAHGGRIAAERASPGARFRCVLPAEKHSRG
jgi:signal transduction histidine kinase